MQLLSVGESRVLDPCAALVIGDAVLDEPAANGVTHRPVGAATPSELLEAGRVAVLHGLGVLDTEAEPAYDELTELAASICGTSRPR